MTTFNKLTTEIAEALAYTLKSNCRSRTDQINIVSDFWASMNRRGYVMSSEVEEIVKFTEEKI